MKNKKVLLIILLIFASLASLPASAAGPTNYTYVYSFWWDEVATPDAYYVDTMIMGRDFVDEDGNSIGNFNNAQGLYIRDNMIYVCDTGNDRIVVIEYVKNTNTYKLDRIFTGLYVDPADLPVITHSSDDDGDEEDGMEGSDDENDGVEPDEGSDEDNAEDSAEEEIEDTDVPLANDFDEGAEEPDAADEANEDNEADGEDGDEEDDEEAPADEPAIAEYDERGFIYSPIKQPYDIFVDRNGEIFIADTGNQRVLRLDKDWNYMNSILRPVSATFESTLDFVPCKLVVDFSGRVFIQARNINRGLMEFDRDGEFLSYMGASKVQINFIDALWRMIYSDEHRRRTQLFVPTEYNNIALDHAGFVYATLDKFTGDANDADPVRRLNAVGSDILVRNARREGGEAKPHGDWYWSSLGGFTGWSRITDVAPFENHSYACLDRNRGRIFVYDFQGNMLYAFGGPGNRAGRFRNATAIEKMDTDLFVLDAGTGNITRFRFTEYGQLINEAMNYYYDGNYDASADKWDEVLKLNGNYDLAYIGKGRAALRNDEFYEAMKYYELKHDQKNYGRAFQLYRKYWIEQNIVAIIIVLVSLFTVTKVLGYVIRRRRGKGGAE